MAQSKTRVLVVGERNEDFLDWIFTILSKEFVVEKLYVVPEPDNSSFFLIRWLLVIKKWKKALNKFNPNKIIIYGEELISIWIIIFLVRLFRLKKEIIVFKYDIENFRPYFGGFKARFSHFISKRIEKFCLLRADKIIHKGLENELEFLSFYDKIKHKPHYLFREFLDLKLTLDYDPGIKLSRKDKEIHTVMVGSLPLANFPYTDSVWEFYPKITKQGLHIHLYMKADKSTENKFRKIESENRLFHYYGYKNHDDLIKGIAKYDYGLFCTSWNRAKIKEFPYLITIMGNRIFDYISVHLPVICSRDTTAAAELVDKYRIGFNIDQKDISSLKEILLKNNKKYLKTIKNIDKAILHFSNHRNFINFLKL